jgi:excisionase family DNA binding protein
MLTIKEVMKQYAVSRPTVQIWMKKGLPYYKVGRLVRFKQEEVDEWIRGYRK